MFLLHVYVQIANTIEEGSTNSTGETTIRLEVLRSSFILTFGMIYDKSTAISPETVTCVEKLADIINFSINLVRFFRY